jgi:hypothetical protein
MHSGVRMQRCGNVRPLSLRTGLCVANKLLLVVGLDGRFLAVPLSSTPDEGVTVLTHRTQTLTPRLREANGGHRWRRTADKLSKPPQVLCSSGEQHLILGTAQATQPKPVELQDALHMQTASRPSCVRTWSRNSQYGPRPDGRVARPAADLRPELKCPVVKGFGPPAGRAACQGRVALLAERAVGLHPHSLPAPAAVARSRAGLREDA